MKKIIAITLALLMCLSLAACGDSGTAEGDEAQAMVDNILENAQQVVDSVLPESSVNANSGAEGSVTVDSAVDPAPATEPENTQPAVERPEGGDLCWTVEGGGTTYNVYYYYTGDAQVYACVSAVNADGSEKWNFVTEPHYVGQLDNYTVIGPTTAGFVFTKEDVVYCLNPVDGSLEWTSEPMGIWPSGYYAIDDSCSFYFPGYYTASLCVIDAGGATVCSYELLKDVYGEPIESGMCDGITVGDGYSYVKYSYQFPTTYVIDPETGCAVDQYVSSLSIEPTDLIGCWRDNFYGGASDYILMVNDDFTFKLTTYKDDGSYWYSYEGHFEIGTFVDDVGNDWIVSHLDSTDDPDFQDMVSIGDYVMSYNFRSEDGLDATIELVQVNNGDSVLSWYFDVTRVILHKFEPVG